MYQTCDDFGSGNVVHGFFGRKGGISEGVFKSLNCGPGSGDDLSAVAENRRRVCNALDIQNISSLYQIHSADCIVIDDIVTDRVEADAIVTAKAGVAIGVLTADCGPILFYGESDQGPVIGAAHAGWGGAVKGVLENTISKMVEQGAARHRIQAAIGPCIGPESYEVSESFLQPFLDHNQESIMFFKPGASGKDGGKFWFDLPAYIKFRLKAAGIGQVFSTGLDTYQMDQDYFSFRRATHRGETQYGRQISVISIRP